MYFTTTAHIARHTDANVDFEAMVEAWDEQMPGWEIDEATGAEDSRYVRECDVANPDADDPDFIEAYDAWREDTFDPDFPW